MPSSVPEKPNPPFPAKRCAAKRVPVKIGELRTDDDPNYEGVGRMIAGNDPEVISVDVAPGALNVFRGHNTAHRVTTVGGDKERMVAVLSLYENPGVRFSDSEKMGFYRRV